MAKTREGFCYRA